MCVCKCLLEVSLICFTLGINWSNEKEKMFSLTRKVKKNNFFLPSNKKFPFFVSKKNYAATFFRFVLILKRKKKERKKVSMFFFMHYKAQYANETQHVCHSLALISLCVVRVDN